MAREERAKAQKKNTTVKHNNLNKNNRAASTEARSQTDPVGINPFNAHAGSPATACRTSAAADVKPLNTRSQNHDHVR